MLRLAITRTAAEAAALAAACVADALAQAPDLVLGLPTGRTSILLYDALVDRHRNGEADFSRARSFNLDEFSGLPPGDPRSYRAFMHRQFFDRVNLPLDRAYLPDGSLRDWRHAAREYDEAISDAGGLDICLAGIGANGHLAFNEPAGALESGTHRERLAPGTRRANAHLFGGRPRDVPTHGLTMGMAALLGARTVILLATGSEKAAIVRRAFAGRITTRVPASLLQAHPNALAVLDRAAAKALGG